jgi:hypothetical protein
LEHHNHHHERWDQSFKKKTSGASGSSGLHHVVPRVLHVPGRPKSFVAAGSHPMTSQFPLPLSRCLTFGKLIVATLGHHPSTNGVTPHDGGMIKPHVRPIAGSSTGCHRTLVVTMRVLILRTHPRMRTQMALRYVQRVSLHHVYQYLPSFLNTYL